MSKLSTGIDRKELFKKIMDNNGFTRDKELYSKWGIKKNTFSDWKTKGLTYEGMRCIAIHENISMDWMALGKGEPEAEVTANPKVELISQRLGHASDSVKDSIIHLLSAIEGAASSRVQPETQTEDIKAAINEYLRTFIVENYPLSVSASEFFNRPISVITLILRREYEWLSIDTLFSMAHQTGTKINISFTSPTKTKSNDQME